MSTTSNQSNVEFSGAVSGSGLTKDQYNRMRQQQTYSTHFMLEDAATRFPNHRIGAATQDGKRRATPRRIKRNLDNLITANDDPQRNQFKADLRKSLKRTIASVGKVEDYDSGSDVSDFDENDYTDL